MMRCAYYQGLDLDVLQNILNYSREPIGGNLGFYDRKTAVTGERIEQHGTPKQCYVCAEKPYQYEYIWKYEVCHRYYVCKDHIIGFYEAKTRMQATEYGGRECNPRDTFLWRKPKLKRSFDD